MTDSQLFENEEIKFQLKLSKDIKNTDVALNAVTNLITMGISGPIQNLYELLITNQSLILNKITHAHWGGLKEISCEYKIPFSNLKDFSISKSEEALYLLINFDNKNLKFKYEGEESSLLNATELITSCIK